MKWKILSQNNNNNNNKNNNNNNNNYYYMWKVKKSILNTWGEIYS